jgi:hypothetical protein
MYALGVAMNAFNVMARNNPEQEKTTAQDEEGGYVVKPPSCRGSHPPASIGAEGGAFNEGHR